jgi:hypothetical protein
MLPLAGAGSRLGLPTPKELLPVGEGRVALDATLDLLAPYSDRLKVVAVVSAGRELTVRYLTRACTALDLPLAITFQDRGLPESTGAVLGASAWFGPATLVLLADQVLQHPAPQAVGEILDVIHGGHRAAFLAARESDAERLGADGALALRETPAGPRVTDFADKPGPEAGAAFNAVWFGYAFSRTAGTAFVQVIHRATLGLPLLPHQLEPLLDIPAVEVGPFSDLGTWPAVTAHWKGARP